MSIFDEARCVGSHDLFDSTDPRDHVQARELCQECPARMACDGLLRQVQSDTSTISGGGKPTGTWAGRYIDATGKERIVQEIHGTPYGYERHRYNGEAACEPCLAAHAAKARQASARRRMAS